MLPPRHRTTDALGWELTDQKPMSWPLSPRSDWEWHVWRVSFGIICNVSTTSETEQPHPKVSWRNCLVSINQIVLNCLKIAPKLLATSGLTIAEGFFFALLRFNVWCDILSSSVRSCVCACVCVWIILHRYQRLKLESGFHSLSSYSISFQLLSELCNKTIENCCCFSLLILLALEIGWVIKHLIESTDWMANVTDFDQYLITEAHSGSILSSDQNSSAEINANLNAASFHRTSSYYCHL